MLKPYNKMTSLKTFSDPFIELPLKVDFDLESDNKNELENLLINKTYNELKKIKEQSIKKTLIFKLLSKHNLKSDVLKNITRYPELLFGYGSIVEFQNKYSLLEYKLFHKINSDNDKKSKLILEDTIEDNDGWEIDEDLDLDLNDAPIAEEPEEVAVFDNHVEDVDPEKSELYALKKRLFTKNIADENKNLTAEQENEIEERNHEDMIKELESLTHSLKNSSVAFQTQLNNTDKDILEKTEANLLSNGERLQLLGKKLGTFSKSKLGIFFYLVSILVMILGLFITYLIIKIFPEM